MAPSSSVPTPLPTAPPAIPLQLPSSSPSISPVPTNTYEPSALPTEHFVPKAAALGVKKSGVHLKYSKWKDIAIFAAACAILIVLGCFCGAFGEKVRCRVKRGASFWEALTGNHVRV